MITEKDVEQYLDEPVRVTLTGGKTFDGLYKYWSPSVALESPDSMNFHPLNGLDLRGGEVEIAAERIVSVRALDH